MAVLGIDLGATKLALALFSDDGKILKKDFSLIEDRAGFEVGKFITDQLKKYLPEVQAIGISVPGISRSKNGTVWAPNIRGWDDYPLLQELSKVAGDIPVVIESDRACSISGEQWQGNARKCNDAIFLAVGTGIGAGILCDGRILRGSHDIAGAVGWMALDKPFKNKYVLFGCFEYFASGDGIARFAREKIANDRSYNGVLKTTENFTSRNVFDAFEEKDPIALQVISECIEYWGMASANLVSIFNPEKIIFGGGVFEGASKFIPQIKTEAAKWAQPISINQVEFTKSALNEDAAIYGAAYFALKKINQS